MRLRNKTLAALLALLLLATPALAFANATTEASDTTAADSADTAQMIAQSADGEDPSEPSAPPVQEPPIASGPQIQNKPKIVIDTYKLDPNPVKAGDRFNLELTFYNTNGINSIRNMKVTLTTQDTTQNSGTVFIPDDTSNTFYARYIAPEGETTRRIRMYVVPDAAQRTYTMTAHFEYEDADGNEFTSSESFGIPVVQRTELTTGQLNIPTETMSYQPTIVPVPFYNTGKTTLYNLTVRLESDMHTDNPQMYVGNFASGSQDQFEINVTPEAAGEQNGKVIFTYEDVAGESYTQEIPFTLNVAEGMGMEDPNMDMGMEDSSLYEQPAQPIWMNPLVWIAAVLLIVIVIVVIRRRKKKKEEEALEIDE